MTKGWFITFEGGEGAGKTAVSQLVKHYLEAQGFEVVLTREPGGVKVAEQIRNILIGPDVEDMDGITEVFLYAAARREHFKDVIQPALDEGKVVLSDRFFDTSLVYQGFVKQSMPWNQILDINLKATNGKQPDLTLYFDIDPKKALERIKENTYREVNRFDKAGIDFHYSVSGGYDDLCASFPDRIKRVNADQTPGQVCDDCLNIINEKLGLKKKVTPITVYESVKLDSFAIPNGTFVAIDPRNFPSSFTFSGPNGKEILKLNGDGTAYWNGKQIEADKELVDAMREFLSKTR